VEAWSPTFDPRRLSSGTGDHNRDIGNDSRVAAILERIRDIPPGHVQAYSDIDARAPRLVGHVLATTRAEVPWHRVVHADGSLPKGRRQRELLLREGVPMRGDRVDIDRARA
jgi:alkylated DNA nucleotide flippase Atl1